MKQGIIGHSLDKFSPQSEIEAKRIIGEILDSFSPGDILVSGHCPLGGIDIWAEEGAMSKGISTDIKNPKQHTWDAEYGFKQRNLDIAKESRRLYVILVDSYPPKYTDKRFNICYHCNSSTHVKSGACWTAKRANEFGNEVIYKIIKLGDEK